jgi:exopolysaccharide production protein ExoY
MNTVGTRGRSAERRVNRGRTAAARPAQRMHVPTGSATRWEERPGIRPTWTLADTGRAQVRWLDVACEHGGAIAKRCFDLVASLTALILLLPLLVVVMTVIRISSPGPALFRQQRWARAGRTFQCLKFRTMYPDADARLDELLRSDPARRAEWEATQKLRDDPRITPVGRLLRCTSLDELPQLVNVIRGEMSLVGPRPKPLAERELYGVALGTVLSVRPGLTGLWQISGRNDTTFGQRIALDVRYVETRTLGGDLVICLRTAGQLLRWRRNGAY